MKDLILHAMESKSCTYRRGIIVELQGSTARVQFINESACASCHAKGACGMSESKLYEVEAIVDSSADFKVGDTVQVAVRNSQGYLALFFGYIFPSILLLMCVVVCSLCGMGELPLALSLLGILVVYYLVLYRFRKRLSRRFSFTISSERELE